MKKYIRFLFFVPFTALAFGACDSPLVFLSSSSEETVEEEGALEGTVWVYETEGERYYLVFWEGTVYFAVEEADGGSVVLKSDGTADYEYSGDTIIMVDGGNRSIRRNGESFLLEAAEEDPVLEFMPTDKYSPDQIMHAPR